MKIEIGDAVRCKTGCHDLIVVTDVHRGQGEGYTLMKNHEWEKIDFDPDRVHAVACSDEAWTAYCAWRLTQ